jgi:hypothetical protein
MLSVFKIIEIIIDKLSNFLNIQYKLYAYKCYALTVYDHPAYGKHIALEKDNSYIKRSY